MDDVGAVRSGDGSAVATDSRPSVTRLRFYAVMAGPVPPSGAVSHEAELVYWSGSKEKADRVAIGQIGRIDQVVPLDGGSGGESGHWLLISSTLAAERPPTVLIVEDDDLNRAFYGTTLRQITSDVHLAATAGEAAAIIESVDIDLALIDIRLPDANGFEVARSMLSTERGRGAIVLLMSAYQNLADREKVSAAGAAGVIMNPVAPDELLQTVEEYLSRPVAQEPQGLAVPLVDDSDARVLLFGPPRVEIEGREVPLPPGRSAELLATLATCSPNAVTSDQIARLAWASSRDVSQGAVYTAISRLRSFLNDAGAQDVIGSGPDGYYLNVKPSQIDLVAFEEAANELYRRPGEVDVPGLRAVMDLWGPGLPYTMPTNHLLTRWESRLLEVHARLSEDLASKSMLLSDYPETISLVTALLDREPWRESAWAMLAKALYRSGRTNDALKTVGEARQRLSEDLGLDPGPGLVAMETMILTHDPALLND